MSTTRTARPATDRAAPIAESPAGHTGTLSGHISPVIHVALAAEGHTSPQAIPAPMPRRATPAGNATARPATDDSTPNASPPAGPDSLSGQTPNGSHIRPAAEGQDPPQATDRSAPMHLPPAGTPAAQPATDCSAPKAPALAGHTNGRDQSGSVTQSTSVPASDPPGAQTRLDTHAAAGTGGQAPPAAMTWAIPRSSSPLADGDQPAAKIGSATKPDAPLADPLLALAADILGDLEKVRIANENRLRQLTRSTEDSDGETRGFGLDENHPDVARLAALVAMLAEAEHKATLNLARLMRNHALGPWVKQQKGIGEKQAARLLAAVGDPYIRPEITREDGIVEPSRPRMVSELWAFAGYHVVRIPVSGHRALDAHSTIAADGAAFPADQRASVTHGGSVGGVRDGHPGHRASDTHWAVAGVAPKRARGQKANWSGAAKMRAFLVAESCVKQMDGGYRVVYDSTRKKYADAIHATECIRCGPKGKPAQPGSPLSAGHQHARALRAVAKEILRDLWREAKRLHEGTPVSGQPCRETQNAVAADGHGIPAGQGSCGTHTHPASGDQAHHGLDGGAR